MIKQQEEERTLEQQKLMKTQDLKYIEMKRVAEAKVRARSFWPIAFPTVIGWSAEWLVACCPMTPCY